VTNNHGIVHFETTADDPDKLAEFYTQLFGWQVQKLDMGGTPYWVIMTGPVDEQGAPSQPGYINGGMTKRTSAEQSAINYVNVESVDQYVTKAKGLGATVMAEKAPVPQMGWFALLKDPQGNEFGVWQNDTSAG
jgi:predicted enzyme related to lactoylglutathione lyase